MKDKQQSIGIVMAVTAMASLLIAGTILAPTQASATSQRKSSPQFNNFNDNTNDNTNTAKSRSTSGGFTDTSSLKHAIRDGVTVNLQHRDQHMDQENLCYRANTCRQSNVGQNTLGNDNSVTGFADQSDNIPQAAAPTPVTPTNQTTNQTSANTNGTTPGGTTINNFIDSSTNLFSLCSLFQVKNDNGTGNTQTGTVTCAVTITSSPNATGIGFAQGQTIPASNIIPRPATGCPAGSVEGIVTLPNGSTIAVCILV
jgi:hypothetical protein